MSSLPTLRYLFDPSGIAADNRKHGERHLVSNLPYKVVVPVEGLFYGDSLVVVDVTTGAVIPAENLYMVEISPEVLLETNKNAFSAIIIKEMPTLTEVMLTYQVVGGEFTKLIPSLEKALAILVNDTRPVNWVDGIYNRPMKFAPTDHPTHIRDTIGWGPVVLALERIREAILMSQVPAYNNLIDWVEQRLQELVFATIADIDEWSPSGKIITMETLIHAMSIHGGNKNFNFTLVSDTYNEISRDHTVIIRVEADAVPDNSMYNWKIEQDLPYITDDPTIRFIGGVATLSVIINERDVYSGTIRFEVLSKPVNGMILGRSQWFEIMSLISYYGPDWFDSFHVVNMSHADFEASDYGLQRVSE